MDKIKRLRVGSLLLAVSQIITLGLIIVVAVLFFIITKSFSSLVSFEPFFSSILLYLGITILAIIILTISGYYYLLRGFKGVDKSGFAGSVLFFVSLFLLLADIPVLINLAEQLFSFSINLSEIVIALIPIVVSLVLFFASDVMIGIGFYHLGSKYNSNTLKAGGALLGASVLIDLVLPEEVSMFFSLLSFVVIYRGLGGIEPKIQVTQAIIKDSEAYVFLETNVNGIIISVKSEGGEVATEITPQSIVKGQNGVVIKFNKKLTSTTLILTLLLGDKTKEIKTTATIQS